MRVYPATKAAWHLKMTEIKYILDIYVSTEKFKTKVYVETYTLILKTKIELESY